MVGLGPGKVHKSSRFTLHATFSAEVGGSHVLGSGKLRAAPKDKQRASRKARSGKPVLPRLPLVLQRSSTCFFLFFDIWMAQVSRKDREQEAATKSMRAGKERI